MRNSARAYVQYVLPKKGMTLLSGVLANATTPWLKNWIIKRFIKQYAIDMRDAEIQDPLAYPSFNAFFTRKLTKQSRPVATAANAIISPADGTIAEIGQIQQQQLLQAKGHYFNLETLFANDKAATAFIDGSYATIYLAPHNYHRVHMPIDGQLEKMLYVPGKLFSVNRLTAEHIPNLYSRNERLITVFNTSRGKMAVIFVGAMIVAGIQPSWLSQPVRSKKITSVNFLNPIHFAKGDELGYFNLGSTVIVLFEKNQATWQPQCVPGSLIHFGEILAI